jgi:hypothetical protein
MHLDQPTVTFLAFEVPIVFALAWLIWRAEHPKHPRDR